MQTIYLTMLSPNLQHTLLWLPFVYVSHNSQSQGGDLHMLTCLGDKECDDGASKAGRKRACLQTSVCVW